MAMHNQPARTIFQSERCAIGSMHRTAAAVPFAGTISTAERAGDYLRVHAAPRDSNKRSASARACSLACSAVFIPSLMVLLKIAPGLGAPGLFRSSGGGNTQARLNHRLFAGSDVDASLAVS